MEDLRRMSSRRWSRRISRWRTRLLDFRAEVVRGDSESRRRASWVMRASRWIEINQQQVILHLSKIEIVCAIYLLEQVLDACLGLIFILCRLGRYGGGLRELGVFVKVPFSLYIISSQNKHEELRRKSIPETLGFLFVGGAEPIRYRLRTPCFSEVN